MQSHHQALLLVLVGLATQGWTPSANGQSTSQPPSSFQPTFPPAPMVPRRAVQTTSTGKIYTLFAGVTNPTAWVLKTWANAEVACRNQIAGGDLASFTNDEQWNAVTMLATFAFSNAGSSHPVLLWTGLNNLRTTENTFSDGSAITYVTKNLTLAALPLAQCKASACYAAIVSAAGVNRTLVQVDCDATPLFFICSSNAATPSAAPTYPPPSTPIGTQSVPPYPSPPATPSLMAPLYPYPPTTATSPPYPPPPSPPGVPRPHSPYPPHPSPPSPSPYPPSPPPSPLPPYPPSYPPPYPQPPYPPPYPSPPSPPSYPSSPANMAGRRSILAHNDFQLTFPASANTLAASNGPDGAAFRLTLRRSLATFFSLPLDQVLFNGASASPIHRRSMIETAALPRSTLLPTAAASEALVVLLDSRLHTKCMGVEHVVTHTKDTSASSWDALHEGESQTTLLDNTMDDDALPTEHVLDEGHAMTQISMTTITAVPTEDATLRLSASARHLLTMPSPAYPPSYPPAPYPPFSPTPACYSPLNAGGPIVALTDVAPFEYFLLTAPLTWSEAVKACTSRSASLAYITTPAELAAVTTFTTHSGVNNVWLQLLSSNMVPYPQFYDDTSTNYTQFATLASANGSTIVPLVLNTTTRCNPTNYSVGCCGFVQTSANGTNIILEDCNVAHSTVCKWIPTPPPPAVMSPAPPTPVVFAPPPAPPITLANVATFVSSMSATLQLDYASLVSDSVKLAGFKAAYSSAILASLTNAKSCIVTDVASGSVVVNYAVTFLASDFASTTALTAYISTQFGGSSASFFSIFPTSFTSSFDVMGASNVILSVGYVCGSSCNSDATNYTPLIIGLTVGIGGGLIAIAILVIVLLRRRAAKRKNLTTKLPQQQQQHQSAETPGPSDQSHVMQVKIMPAVPKPKDAHSGSGFMQQDAHPHANHPSYISN